ncbi:hypothetical protein LXL04_022274 [Taraxacum kok-saghyz]
MERSYRAMEVAEMEAESIRGCDRQLKSTSRKECTETGNRKPEIAIGKSKIHEKHAKRTPQA